MAALPWVAMLAAWIALFGESFVRHVAHSFSPFTLEDDTRIPLPYFYHFADETLFPRDAIGKYHADGTPEIFRAIYFVAAQVGDVETFSRLLGHLLFALTVIGLGVAVRKLAGTAAVFLAVALCFSASVFLDRTAGALPRAFAYPVLAWTAASLTAGWIWPLIALTVLGAGLYPPLTPVVGGTLALVLLFMDSRDRGAASPWSFRRRFLTLALTGIAAAALTLPMALRMSQYGSTIGAELLSVFPEAAPGGRAGPDNQLIAGHVSTELAELAENTVASRGKGIVPEVREYVRDHRVLRNSLEAGLLVLVLVGFIALGLRQAAARRLAALALSSISAYALSSLVNPALGPPQRALQFSVPVLLAIAVPSAPLGLFTRRWLTPGGCPQKLASAVLLGFAALVLVTFGGRTDTAASFSVRLTIAENALFQAIAGLPKRAVIAGWPQGTLDSVPLLTRRAALVTYQTYQPYHVDMTLSMRKRMDAMLDVFYEPKAPDLGALRRLRDEFGVTHFLLEDDLLEGAPPSFLFRPFKAQLHRRFQRWRRLPKAERRADREEPVAQSTVYDRNGFRLLDLAKLGRN